MRIVLTAPIEEPVPPVKYGGTELVVSNLAEEMIRLGHEVYLLASGDSQTSAQLVPLIPTSLRKMYRPSEIDTWRNVLKVTQLAKVLQEIKRLQPDVVYNHQGWRLAPFIPLIDCPVFTTIHGPLNTPQEEFTYRHYPKTPLISISLNQRLAMPKLNWVKNIYNGIDIRLFPLSKAKNRDYFAFLGRVSPEKGLKEICLMIKNTQHKLKIAAKVDTVDVPYFEQEIKPLIDGQQIEFIGEIGPKQKARFLQKAKGLLLWLNWEEPFGLVVIEALACGTPVIVNRRGAMSEIMSNGKTGFLVSNLLEMQTQLDQVERISSKVCRQQVLDRFTARKMTTAYLSLATEKNNYLL